MSKQVGKIIFDMPKRHKKIESAAVERLAQAELKAITNWVYDALSSPDYWTPGGANLTRLAEDCAIDLGVNILNQDISDDLDNEVFESVSQWVADWGEQLQG